MLRDCGVASNDEAEQVLRQLTGKHGLTPRLVGRQDADNLLTDPDFMKRKIMQALQEIRKPQQEQVPEVVDTTTTNPENTDGKEQK